MIATKPGALTRLRAAVRFYKDGWRKFQMQPLQTKKIPFIWPTWFNGQPQWQLINYEAYANEGFNANAIIYSAIMYKVRSITIAPLRAYTGTAEAPELLPPDHPLQSLCMRPNRFQSQSEFQAQATVYFNLSGNNYTFIDRRADEILGLYNLRPDRVFIVPDQKRNQLIGYYYVPEGRSYANGIPYLPQDIIHIKLPNPMDPLDGLGYGISPLSPAAHNGDVDNDLTKFFRLFFKAGAMPPGVLSYDVPMDNDDVSQARERWMEIYGGYENWKDVAVLDQGGTYERIGFTFEEMDVSSIDARNESRIVAPFGVPLNLIESRPVLVQSTYNNKAEDRKMFWEDTMTPELHWFETDYQYYLQSGDGAFVKFDLSQIPALSMDRKTEIEAFGRGYERGAVLVDEYRARLGLDPMPEEEIIEEPESSITNGNMDDQPEAEEQAEEEIANTNGRVKKKSIDRLKFWTKADKLARDYETEFSEAATNAFGEDQLHIEVIINDLNQDALDSRASLNWAAVQDELSRYFSKPALDNWRRQFALPLYQLMADRIRELNKELAKALVLIPETKQGPTVADLLAQEWFNEYTIQFAQPINATTEEAIRRVIEQGLTEGWTVPQMQNNIKQVFEQWMTGSLTAEEFAWFADRMPDYRVEMIARTETIKALNTVSVRLYGEWGIEEHEWLATQDDRVRDDHAAADGQRVRLGTPFKVGGESLLYPGDPAGSPGNIINCRCTTAPII